MFKHPIWRICCLNTEWKTANVHVSSCRTGGMYFTQSSFSKKYFFSDDVWRYLTQLSVSRINNIVVPPHTGSASIVMSMFLCLSFSVSGSVCPSVCPRGYLRNHTSDRYQIFVHVAYGSDSVLFRRRCDTFVWVPEVLALLLISTGIGLYAFRDVCVEWADVKRLKKRTHLLSV